MSDLTCVLMFLGPEEPRFIGPTSFDQNVPVLPGPPLVRKPSEEDSRPLASTVRHRMVFRGPGKRTFRRAPYLVRRTMGPSTHCWVWWSTTPSSLNRVPCGNLSREAPPLAGPGPEGFGRLPAVSSMASGSPKSRSVIAGSLVPVLVAGDRSVESRRGYHGFPQGQGQKQRDFATGLRWLSSVRMTQGPRPVRGARGALSTQAFSS